MATTKLLLKSKANPAAIYLRYCNGKAIDLIVPTGLFTDPAKFNPEKQDDFHIKLAELRIFVIKQSNLAFSNGEILNKSWLEATVKLFFNRPKNENKGFNEPHTIYASDFADWWMKNKSGSWKVKKGKYLGEKCKIAYSKANDLLKQFEGKKKIRLKDFSLAEIERFAEFLESKDYSVSTVEKFVGRVRFFLNRAKDEKLEVDATFNGKLFFEEQEEIDGVYLNEDEIESVFNLNLSDDDFLDAARDNFILSLRSALRVSDLLYNLDISNIKDGIIKIKTKKTGKFVAIPVHEQVKLILNKRYGQLPSKMTDVKYNIAIKEISRLAGITEITYGKLFDKETKRKKSGYYPKNLLISSHIARRSFATSLKGKVPDEVIMSCAGWSSDSLLSLYDKTTKLDRANQLSEYWQKQQK